MLYWFQILYCTVFGYYIYCFDSVFYCFQILYHTVSRYHDYRYGPDVEPPLEKYKYTADHWHVFMGRLAFIIVFEVRLAARLVYSVCYKYFVVKSTGLVLVF